MNFMTTERAVDFVAASLLSSLLEMHGGESWGDYPEIGEDDWQDVVARAKEIADDPGPEAFRMAYAHLEARAVAWEKDHS